VQALRPSRVPCRAPVQQAPAMAAAAVAAHTAASMAQVGSTHLLQRLATETTLQHHEPHVPSLGACRWIRGQRMHT
jgi:hypothetical protein